MSERKVGVVAFEFGSPSDSPPNKLIVEIAQREAEKLGGLVFLQGDICEEGYLTTYRVAKLVLQWAKERGVTNLYISAAAPHVERCLRDVRYLVEKTKTEMGVLGVHICQEIWQYKQHEEWFCSESTQPWTRSMEAWKARNRWAKVMPMWLYRLADWLIRHKK